MLMFHMHKACSVMKGVQFWLAAVSKLRLASYRPQCSLHLHVHVGMQHFLILTHFLHLACITS